MKRLNGRESNMNTKQRKTRESVLKEGDEFTEAELEKNIRTFITHNKGGKWELVKAPTEDSQGKKISCYMDEGCSLHLNIYSSNGYYAPPYSQDSAIGIVMAVGNTGKELDVRMPERINTYFSRDGGLNWAEVSKGAHIYEIGDHGALMVMAKNREPTKIVMYSFNEGKSWHELEISQVPIDITNIIIEPQSISQQFVIYGGFIPEGSSEPKGMIINLDFANLHEP